MKNTNSHPNQANHPSHRTSSILTMVLFIACVGFILVLLTQQIARLFPTLAWVNQWLLGGVVLLLIGIGWLAFFAIQKKSGAQVAVRGKNCMACPPLNRTIPLIRKEQFPSLIRQIQKKMRAGVLVALW